jgi:DNA-binding transcriptional ArsR family regulator
MLVLRFATADLAQVRFAVSPLLEAMRSVRVLADPGAHALHLPWIAEAREKTCDLSLETLQALQPAKVYSPDFINPPPDRPLMDFDEELEQMVATPPRQVRSEIERAFQDRELPAVLEPFLSDPPSAMANLAALLREYWQRTLAHHWTRIRAVLQGDVLHRARMMAAGGASKLFRGIDPSVSWADGQLRIDKSFEDELDLRGLGLVLVPSTFVWPQVLAVTDPRWQPTLIYPARGVALLWEPKRVSAPEALAALVGRIRAAVLTSLDEPQTTTQVARSVGVTSGSVSQHLRVLRDAGLVTGHRAGRVVLYMRTPAGDLLADSQGTPS